MAKKWEMEKTSEEKEIEDVVEKEITERGPKTTKPFTEWIKEHPRVKRPKRLSKKYIDRYPVIPLKQIIFPDTMDAAFFFDDLSIESVELARRFDDMVVGLAVRRPDVSLDDVLPEDLYDTIGVLYHVDRVLRMPDDSLSAVLQGVARVIVKDLGFSDADYLEADVFELGPEFNIPRIETPEDEAFVDSLGSELISMLEKAKALTDEIPEDVVINAMNSPNLGSLADYVVSTMELPLSEQQRILEIIDPVDRAYAVAKILGKKIKELELRRQIQFTVQQEMERSQREYYLREQIRAIRNELGEGDDFSDVEGLREKIREAHMPEEVQKKAEKELARLASMPPNIPETSIIRTYLDWLTSLPWVKQTEDNLDIAHAEKVLESNHYGLDKVKERLLEYIAVRKLANSKMRSPILCFVGPPGTGKTSMGKSIAEALGRKFVRVSLGGVRDEAEIRGHRRTYIGALPGRIIQTMRNAGTINPLFMLDEIDKMGADFRGDPAAALLEVLDPEQNHAFVDHYLDVPYDLSKVLFITTANSLFTVPPALEDRMEVIEFPGYTEEEKVEIAVRFLIPRQLEEHGLPNSVKFSRNAIHRIISEYTYEAGVRNLERNIATVLRKLARRLAEGKSIPDRITEASIEKYLGPPQHQPIEAEKNDEVGVATGLAWTSAGGDIMSIEVLIIPGKGNITMTGQLGDVMQESAQAALSYARAHAKEFGFGDVDFDKIDIHIHVPEGGIPKDGPSAGVTIATALISALSGVPVRKEVAMTGEITLRGKVLPVGGLKEKLLAARRAGIKTVLIPTKNKKDLSEIPKSLLGRLRILTVESMEQVLQNALLRSKVEEGEK